MDLFDALALPAPGFEGVDARADDNLGRGVERGARGSET